MKNAPSNSRSAHKTKNTMAKYDIYQLDVASERTGTIRALDVVYDFSPAQMGTLEDPPFSVEVDIIKITYDYKGRTRDVTKFFEKHFDAIETEILEETYYTF